MSSFNGIAQGRVKCPETLSEKGYNLRAAFSDFPDVLKGWQGAAKTLIEKHQPRQDIAYGDRPLQNLDFYKANGGNTPLLVFIHGGYWQSGDKSDVGFIAAPYVQAGISVAVINYSLAPDAPMEQMVAEVRTAVKWLHTESSRFSVDPNRISLMGHSAGGHLAAMMVTRDDDNRGMPPIRHVFAISGVFDLPPLLPSMVNDALSLDAQRAELLSPSVRPAPLGAQVHTIIGEHETGQFHLQSAALAQRWGACVTNHHVVPDTHHFTVLDAMGDPQSPFSGEVVNVINAR